jgi:hypothetical protein
VQQMVEVLRVVCVCMTVEDCECERKATSYSDLENVFSECCNSVFWDNILSKVHNSVNTPW